ncbi:MAG TPA: hypothetical protein PKK43_16040, partial [Spirochaetota bacterium]|nr:hypothetical protein [Spirochaetota bacterium]
KRALTALFIIGTAVYICGGLFAQEADSPEVSVNAEAEGQKSAVSEPVKSQSPASGKNTVKTGNPVSPETQNSNSAGSDSLSLIEMNDGDFRSARIPGITFAKKGVIEAGKNDAAQNAGEKVQATKKRSLERMIPFLTVVGIVVLIVLVYRIGKRKRRGNVFRRFP